MRRSRSTARSSTTATSSPPEPAAKRHTEEEGFMKKRDFLKASAGAGLVLPAVAAAQSGPTYNWKMATAWPGGPLMDIGAKAFAEKMEMFSGGRFKIQTFPGGALGNALKVPETVKNGVAE